MSEAASVGKKGRYLDATIIAMAIAVRVAAVLVLRNHEVARSTYEHGEIAANLLAGQRVLGTVPRGGWSDLAAGSGLSESSWRWPMRSEASARPAPC